MTTETTTAPAETYLELRARHQAEFDAFPFFTAFNNAQLAEGMQKLGVTDPRELCRMGNLGCFYRKADAPRFHDMMKRHADELADAMQGEEFAVDAFKYELANHEYCITLDPTDALYSLGYSVKMKKDAEGWNIVDWPATFGGSATLEAAFSRAIREYRQEQRELGY